MNYLLKFYLKGFSEKKFQKRKREQGTDDTEKIIKASGYDEFLNGDKKKKKFRKDDTDGGETNFKPKKQFDVKFEKKGAAPRPAKFLRFSNKKSSSFKSKSK